METISPDHQSSIGTPPPLSKFSVTITPHQHILPPIKSLPSWHRTKFGLRKTVEPANTQIARKRNPSSGFTNKSALSEQFTQTSPLSSRQSSTLSSGSASSSKSSIKPSSSSSSSPSTKKKQGNLKNLYDKKIVFLQSTHSEVLAGLHKELEQLQFANKGTLKSNTEILFQIVFKAFLSNGMNNILTEEF